MSDILDFDSGLSKEDESFEKGWLNALRRFGYVFPSTQDELDALEKELAKSKLQFPKHLEDPFEVMRRAEAGTLKTMGDYRDPSIEENLARAAREGGEIPDDVNERMKKDRHSAEESAEDAE